MGWSTEEAREEPVHPDRCVFCKHDLTDTDSVDLDADGDDPTERLCRTCLEDLRAFKRSERLLWLASDGLSPTLLRVLNDQFDAIMAEVQAAQGEDNIPRLDSDIRNALRSTTNVEADTRRDRNEDRD